MPQPTFFALPAPKRKRVIEAAVIEFGAHAYGQASLDRIATAAKVSKGSLYQYFSDKQDLYSWLLTEYLPQQKRSNAPPSGDLLCFLEQAFLQGIERFREQPHLAALAARAAMPVSEPEAAEVHAQLRAATHAGLLELIRAGKANGSVREEVPSDLAAELIAQLMGSSLLATVARRAGLAPDALLKKPRLAAELSKTEVATLVVSASELLRRAIGQ